MRSKNIYALSWSGDVENIISGFFQFAEEKWFLWENDFVFALMNFNK